MIFLDYYYCYYYHLKQFSNIKILYPIELYEELVNGENQELVNLSKIINQARLLDKYTSYGSDLPFTLMK